MLALTVKKSVAKMMRRVLMVFMVVDVVEVLVLVSESVLVLRLWEEEVLCFWA